MIFQDAVHGQPYVHVNNMNIILYRQIARAVCVSRTELWLSLLWNNSGLTGWIFVYFILGTFTQICRRTQLFNLNKKMTFRMKTYGHEIQYLALYEISTRNRAQPERPKKQLTIETWRTVLVIASGKYLFSVLQNNLSASNIK